MTRKPRGNFGRFGLFDNPTSPDAEVQDNPLLRACPACKAAPRQRCTRPGRGGRIPLKAFHDARKPTEPSTGDTNA